MSFSSEVKNELVKNEITKACCKKSMLYGMALFSKSFSFDGILFQSENENAAYIFKKMLVEQLALNCSIRVSPSGRNFSISISNRDRCRKIMSYFGHTRSDKNLKINFSNLDCPECYNAFLAGAFLSCGTVSSPERDYHLEFIVQFMNLSKSFITFLRELELEPKLTKRNGYNVVYFKDSEKIEDCLYIMGAPSSMFSLMNVKIYKEIRNSANRRANCETANIDKTVRAAMPQIEAINKIKRKKGLGTLSEPLREMAQMRLENPDVSLSELAKMFDPPLSRSGANHRLKRIMKIADEL